MRLNKFARFLQVSLKGLFSRPWIISKYPKLVVIFEKARKSNSIWYKSLMLSASGGTLKVLRTVSLVFPFEFWGGAVSCLSFFFTGEIAAQLQIHLQQVSTPASVKISHHTEQPLHYQWHGQFDLHLSKERDHIPSFRSPNGIHFLWIHSVLIISANTVLLLLITLQLKCITVHFLHRSVSDRDQKIQFHDYPLQNISVKHRMAAITLTSMHATTNNYIMNTIKFMNSRTRS